MAVIQEEKPQSVLNREALIAIGFILALGYIIFKFGASVAKNEIRVPK